MSFSKKIFLAFLLLLSTSGFSHLNVLCEVAQVNADSECGEIDNLEECMDALDDVERLCGVEE